MKYSIRYITGLIIGGAFLSSCSKTVDIDPTHTVNGENFFTTVEDYDLALTGAYQRLKLNSLYGGVNGGSVFLCAVDVAADNFYSGANNLGSLNTMFRWNYTADGTVPQGAWNSAYNVIQQCNLTVRGIDKLKATDEGAVNRIEGQARALRAYMHFELLRWWSDNYDRNSTALGLAYVDNFDVEQMPARGTVKQTYDKIENDFKTARQMMSFMDKDIQSLNNLGPNRAYIDTLVVDAMLARMYIYSNQLDSAIKYSSYVINARPLATASEFPLIWQDAITKEVVWSIKYQAGEEALAREIYQPAGDLVSWRPVLALLALYDPSDVRTDAYWINKNGRVVLNKYAAKSTAAGNPDGITDFKIFRTGEMYLVRAEAYARKGLNAAGLADLNTLRTARNAIAGNESGAALEAAIQTERRKELVVEGHRFFDIKRTTRTINRTQNCSSFCTLASNNRAWNLPVPQNEILANENMVQNPGY
jgi:hypothetical protein